MTSADSNTDDAIASLLQSQVESDIPKPPKCIKHLDLVSELFDKDKNLPVVL